MDSQKQIILSSIYTGIYNKFTTYSNLAYSLFALSFELWITERRGVRIWEITETFWLNLFRCNNKLY